MLGKLNVTRTVTSVTALITEGVWGGGGGGGVGLFRFVVGFLYYFNPILGFCAKKRWFFCFGVLCGLQIFPLLAFGFRLQ